MALTLRAHACIIIGMKRYIPFLILLTALLCVFVATEFSTDLAYADEIPVVEFTYDSSDGQTEYVGNNFVAKLRGTDTVLYVGAYDETTVKSAIESEIGTEYNVVIPSPVVGISLRGDVYESEFSPVVHPFSLTATASHPFWRISGAFATADPESDYAWRYSTEDTDGVEVEFGGTASSVGFGGGRSHGVYTIRAMATVSFKFANSTLYAGDVSEGVELTITRASSEPDVSSLVETVDYGKSVNDILSSKNIPSGDYHWALEKSEFGDSILDVGNYAYSVVVTRGRYYDGNFVKDDNFTDYTTTLAVKVKEKQIYVKVSDVNMVFGRTMPALGVELHDSYLATGQTIEDVGITATNTDFSVGRRKLTFDWSNKNYIVYFMSTRTDGLRPQLAVYPDSVQYSDENFNYTAYRDGGFDFDDKLAIRETDDGFVLEIVRAGEVVYYDDITLVLTKAKGSKATGIGVGSGLKEKQIEFDGDGRIVLSGLDRTFTVITADSEKVDYVSLAIGLGGWVAAVVVGFALSLIVIKGKKRKPEEGVEKDVEELSETKEDSAGSAVVEPMEEQPVVEESVETESVETIDDTVERVEEKEAKTEQKRKLNSTNRADKTSKSAYDEDNKERFESVGFAPTPTVEEAFKGLSDEDVENKDDDERDEKEESGKITFSSKMAGASIQNQAIYNALKNELRSYRGVKSRVVNGGDYFRRPGKQIAKIILIGKTIRLALALDPSDYDYNLYHQKDRSGMKKYADTPTFIKVQSPLGVRRAFTLIADLMEKEGLKKDKKFEYEDAMYALLFGENEEE